MSSSQVNVLNIGLMVAACIAAFALPFELFLFSYAVLGPLHYLTQISWLHTRGYFTTGGRDYVWLVTLAVCLLLLRYVLVIDDQASWATAVVCVAFVSAGAMALVTSTAAKIGVVLVSVMMGLWLSSLDAVQIVLLTFVPTIIHVYVFTAAFILHGALKSRSWTGVASLGVFMLCTASFFFYAPGDGGHVLSAYVQGTYALFTDVNVQLAEWLRLPRLTGDTDVYTSRTGLMLMRFIAFAYTYHYLNWFSKTSIIQWHKIPRAWSAVNVALWLAALGLYAWDYRTGLLVLFGLSWLHVLLEFPLDHRTFAGIGRELAVFVRTPGVLAAPAPAVAAARTANARPPADRGRRGGRKRAR
jgi:hypothetical protein